jgi:hypothetical protein
MEMAPIRQLIKCFSAHRTRLDGMIMLDVAHENPSPATFPSDLKPPVKQRFISLLSQTQRFQRFASILKCREVNHQSEKC